MGAFPKLIVKKTGFLKYQALKNLPEKVSWHGIIVKKQIKGVPFAAHLFMILILKVPAKFCNFEK